jgi:hypothetical protein
VLSIIVWIGRLIYEHTLNVFDAAQADGDHDHVTPLPRVPIIITAFSMCMINAALSTRWQVLCQALPMSHSLTSP